MSDLDQILSMEEEAAQPAEPGLQGGTPQGAGTQAPANPPPAGFSNLDRILNDGHAIDDLTGEAVPLAFSGHTPETAMNYSPVTAKDRLYLSFGNQAGNIEYLKKRFNDVKPIPDKDGKPTRHLAVLDGNTWYRVDANNGDIQDPWELAKEYVKDAADLGDIGIGMASTATTAAVAGAVGVGGTVATGGAAVAPSLAAASSIAASGGALSFAVRTSLGRLVGTYKADPAEQVWDLSMEMALNAAGVRIAAGVKPTATWMAGQLDKMAKWYGGTAAGKATARGAEAVKPYLSSAGEIVEGIAETPKDLFRTIMAVRTVGRLHFDNMVTKPKEVGTFMRYGDQMSKGMPSAERALKYQDVLTHQQLKEIHGKAETISKFSSQLYSAAKTQLLGQVPKNFSTNFDDPIKAVYIDALDKGIGKIDLGDETLYGKQAVEWLEKHGLEGIRKYGGYQAKSPPSATTKAVEIFGGDRLSRFVGAASDDTIELARQSGGKARFSMLTPEELISRFKEGAPLQSNAQYLANNADAHKAVAAFYNKIGEYAGAKSRTGAQAAEDLIEFKKGLGKLAYDISQREDVRSLGDVRGILIKANHVINSSIHNKFKAAEPTGKLAQAFTDLNADFDTIKTATASLSKAHEKYLRDGENLGAYTDILKSYLGPAARTVDPKSSVTRLGQENALENMRTLANKYRMKGIAEGLDETKDRVLTIETAKVFNPLKPGDLKRSDLMANVQTFGVYAVASGNPSMLASVVSNVLLQKPGTARAGAAISRGTWATKEFMSKTPPKALDKMLSTYEGVNAIAGGGAAAGLQYIKTSGELEQLMQQAQQAGSMQMQPGPGMSGGQ
jgi:hypothetical protein